MRLKALIGAFLLALASGATFAWRPEPKATSLAASRFPAPTQIAAFTVQAEQACRCARTRSDEPGKKACWAGFERAIAPWPQTTEGSLCEFSFDGVCLGEDLDGEAPCIIKGWQGPVGGPGSICTQAELQTAEAVFYEASQRYSKDPTEENPDEALKRTLAAFARNDRIALRRTPGGCGGG